MAHYCDTIRNVNCVENLVNEDRAKHVMVNAVGPVWETDPTYSYSIKLNYNNLGILS